MQIVNGFTNPGRIIIIHTPVGRESFAASRAVSKANAGILSINLQSLGK
jgi:hypothetical protein